MKLKKEYEGDQTPAERLRNKLSPFFALVQMVKDDPSILADGPFKELALQSANDAASLSQDVRDHIDDAAEIERRYIEMKEHEARRYEKMQREHGRVTDGEEFDEAEERAMEVMDEDDEAPSTGLLNLLNGGGGWREGAVSEEEERLRKVSGIDAGLDKALRDPNNFVIGKEGRQKYEDHNSGMDELE